MSYTTAANIRGLINKTSVADDAILTTLISAAELAINNFTNRPDGFEAVAVATARKYTGSGRTYQWIDECVEITKVEVKDSPTDSTYVSWAATDYLAGSGDVKEPNYNSLPYVFLIADPTGDYSTFTSGGYSFMRGFPPDGEEVRGVPTVQVTARWGYSAVVPATITKACEMQTIRWYKRLESAMADALASAELGQLLYRQELDPDVKFILVGGRYVKPSIGRRY